MLFRYILALLLIDVLRAANFASHTLAENNITLGKGITLFLTIQSGKLVVSILQYSAIIFHSFRKSVTKLI